MDDILGGMNKYMAVCIHKDSPGQTLHDSVAIPDIVPLVVDFNPAQSVGRARAYWNAEHTKLYADIYLDDAVPFLADPILAIHMTTGTYKGTVEVGGTLSGVSITTESTRDAMYNGTWEDPEPPLSAA